MIASRDGSMFRRPRYAVAWIALAAIVAAIAAPLPARAAGTLAGVVDELLPKVVKIYGAGGFRGLEAYQSGMLISAEGHVLTAWSYVLDTDQVTVTLHDGRRYTAELIGADPRLELAVLKIDASNLPHVDVSAAPEAAPGTRILALSNLFGVATGNEPVSVQHGVIAAVAPLAARRGVFETPYQGTVYVLDVVTNNPGAAGGLLTDRRGRPLGMLGKELRNAQTNVWLNYVLPFGELEPTVAAILDGKFAPSDSLFPDSQVVDPLSPERLGIVLVPDVLERTPAYIDSIRAGSAAAGHLEPDDLVLFVNDRLVQSCKGLLAELRQLEAHEQVILTVERGRELVTVVLDGSSEGRSR